MCECGDAGTTNAAWLIHTVSNTFDGLPCYMATQNPAPATLTPNSAARSPRRHMHDAVIGMKSCNDHSLADDVVAWFSVVRHVSWIT